MRKNTTTQRNRITLLTFAAVLLGAACSPKTRSEAELPVMSAPDLSNHPIYSNYDFGMGESVIAWARSLPQMLIIGWVYLQDVPLDSHEERIENWKKQIVKGLDLVADREEEELLRWIDERGGGVDVE